MNQTVESLLARTTREGDCLVWRGSIGAGGYGTVRHGGRNVRAHRLLYILLYGPLPGRDMFVCHRCDNPPCINPEHLFAGSNADNIKDCIAKGRFRQNHVSGERHGMARLTVDRAADIRASADSDAVLAQRFGVTPATVWSVRVGRTWRTE